MSRKDLANAIRALSMDAVQKANSGHPGAPMGMADIAEVLWNDFLKHNPTDPTWYDRDRFILSNGHASMLLYSLLHLTGYDLPLEELKNFRQLHSKTPGHPEIGYTPGVETTTGPLGQGLANAVGLAIAERTLAAQFNQPDHEIVDHFTYVFMGDGCLKTMGKVGVALAMIGVVICPITSGDTAFRSARLTLSDWLKIDQDSYANRLKLCVPVLGVGAFLGIGNALGFIDYTVIWRYFSWTNQTLAMIVLWAASMYLFKEKKNFWITAVPATFMSAVSCTYFVLAPECLGKMINTYADGKLVAYNTAVAYPIGIVFAIAMLALFIYATKKNTEKKAA